ncbi:hypothetical protein BDQ17DRAFT_1325026 [Cyathus striatus]|nr:hypothetical protein BDQ17DRAFT_1325026 [Cyathus striatus]
MSSSANNIVSSEPTKTSGQFHSVKGTPSRLSVTSLVLPMATIGQVRACCWRNEYTAAQAKGYVEGTADRIVGKKDAVVGALTGDKCQQASGNVRHDKGEAQQKINTP